MGQKGNNYQSSFLKQCVNQESRSQSLPDGFTDDTSENNCTFSDNNNPKPEQDNSQLNSNELWFKTWPERCDKIKNNDSSSDPAENTKCSKAQDLNTQTYANCDSPKNANKTKLTFNEALQNISLAYSPITKQLHLVQKPSNNNDLASNNGKTPDIEIDNKTHNGTDEIDFVKKLGHRRIQQGSFSSTVSTSSGLSDPSTSGSLLDVDERSISSFDENSYPHKKNSFSNFFSR